MVVWKELTFNSFYVGCMWWCWNNLFLTVSTLDGCGGLELIFNSFYVRRVWWSWKNWFLTVSNFGGCGGPDRGVFLHSFLFWVGVVVLKELTFNSFFFRRVWQSWKKWYLIVPTLGACGGLERHDFYQVLFWAGLVFLKELIFNSFYFGRVWLFQKNWLLTVSTLSVCGGVERNDF